MMCACLGPQNGQPLCPCRMRAARDYYFAPSWSMPQQAYQWFPQSPACWNDIACQLHDCRSKGCAVIRNTRTDAAPQPAKEGK